VDLQEALEKHGDLWGYGGEMHIKTWTTLWDVAQDLGVEFSREGYAMVA